jgi:hypothetical protein
LNHPLTKRPGVMDGLVGDQRGARRKTGLDVGT